jgi:hypothetical protein
MRRLVFIFALGGCAATQSNPPDLADNMLDGGTDDLGDAMSSSDHHHLRQRNRLLGGDLRRRLRRSLRDG